MTAGRSVVLDRERKAFRVYAAVMLCFALMFALGTVAFAAETASAAPAVTVTATPAADEATAEDNEAIGAVNKLSDFIFAIIRVAGVIILGWGIVQVGLSIQSHDPSQRSNGILTVVGGLIVTFAKEIIDLVTA